MRGSKPENEEYLIVDGYNIIGGWEELRVLAKESLADARDALADTLLNYCGFCGKTLVLVFDAHGVNQPQRQIPLVREGGHHIVFTKRGQTADQYIERFVRSHAGARMSVASSDSLLQVMVLSHASRISARELELAVQDCVRIVRGDMVPASRKKRDVAQRLDRESYEKLDKMRRGEM